MEPVCFQLKMVFTFCVFSFFFPAREQINHIILLCRRQKTLFMHYLRTVHESHNIIHTFKNYFAIMFSVFNFNNNKFNPNRPQTRLFQLLGTLQPVFLIVVLEFFSIFTIKKKLYQPFQCHNKRHNLYYNSHMLNYDW